jgi:hypothetical protein
MLAAVLLYCCVCQQRNGCSSIIKIHHVPDLPCLGPSSDAIHSAIAIICQNWSPRWRRRGAFGWMRPNFTCHTQRSPYNRILPFEPNNKSERERKKEIYKSANAPVDWKRWCDPNDVRRRIKWKFDKLKFDFIFQLQFEFSSTWHGKNYLVYLLFALSWWLDADSMCILDFIQFNFLCRLKWSFCFP